MTKIRVNRNDFLVFISGLIVFSIRALKFVIIIGIYFRIKVQCLAPI
jgi:hypothetical protein